MHASGSGLEGGEYIARRKVIVIVRVEVEMNVRIGADHLTHQFRRIPGIQNAQGVGEHETLHAAVLQALHQEHHIVLRMEHAVGPVLEIEIHLQPPGVRQGYAFAYVVQMLLRSLFQLSGDVL